ncbi:MAG: DNA polymerase III subunit gamma/tau [Nitrospiraceae bacterium]|nr:DNA polymerase III subunit gamma/tau [Nitrospiraceae bacterium]
MSYLVLARKWRPQNFDDLIGQEPIARVLKNAISQGKTAHAYVFSGPRGVGKTSAARILAKALNCAEGPTTEPCGKCESCLSISDGSSMDVSEIDGASNTGVDNIRDLRERVRYAATGGRYKIYIIDEAHMLSISAFNALLKTLEEPPPHVIFVLATTEPKKIPATVLSRCQHLPFRRMTTQKVKERLKHICKAEPIKITDPALEMIARAADGSMRDSLTILDQIASFSEDITETEVKDLLGITDTQTLSELTSAMLNGDTKKIVETISVLADSGADLKIFTKDLLQFMRDLLISKITGGADGVLDLAEEDMAAISSIRQSATEEHIALILSDLIKAEPIIRNALYPRIALEMSLIKAGMFSRLSSVADILKGLPVSEAKTAAKIEQQPGPSSRPVHTKKTAPAAAEPAKEPLKAAPAQNPAPAAPAKAVDTETAWQAVINTIDEEDHFLATQLRAPETVFSGDTINLIFNGGQSVFADNVKQKIGNLSQMLKQKCGKTVAINISSKESTSVSKKELKEKALENPIINEALELFEGRIIDVIPNQENNQKKDKQ